MNRWNGTEFLLPRDGIHDWALANHRMAKVLKAKGYEYQYLFCRNAGHSIGNAQAQFLPHAIEWVWRGYGARGAGDLIYCRPRPIDRPDGELCRFLRSGLGHDPFQSIVGAWAALRWP